MIKQYRIRDYDFKLILLVVSLTIIGILAIGSAKESLQTRQIAGFVFGMFLMVVISLFDYTVILRFYWVLYAINIILLFGTIILGGSKITANGDCSHEVKRCLILGRKVMTNLGSM